ncbi:MAG: hypothetical protein Q8P79_03125 [Nanoarchaeota archaeon]|nr:hypothetical protein [Nanoarchaeota archaeon]
MNEQNPQQPQKQQQPPPEQEQPQPVFNVPQLQPQMQQPPPEQPVQQTAEPEPEKKKGWKIWMIIAVVIFIAAGLGFYFLR